MRLKLLIVICAVAVAVSGQPQRRRVVVGGAGDENRTKGWPQAEAGLPAFEKFLDEIAARDLFSGTVLITRGEETLLQKSFGHADKEHAVPNTTDTKYNLGSINKIFTHVALLQLRKEGKIDFSKSVHTYLPDFASPITRDITVAQLIEHSSGMGDIFGPKFDDTPKQRIRTLQDYVPFFRDQPLQFDPGTRRRYSNAGYVVLGLIVEKLSGMSYYDYVRTKIFAPAGMNDTASYAVDEVVPRRATGYTGPNHALANTYELPGRGSSAGGGYSTVTDLLRFTRAVRMNYRELVGDVPGVGWGGGAPGVNATIEMEGDYTIIVLSNYDPPAASHVAQNARRALGLGGDE